MSDFTLGDFWGIWEIDNKMDDDKGTSLVLVHSNKGKNIWEKLNRHFVWKEYTTDQVSLRNQSILLSVNDNPSRKKALRYLNNNDFVKLEKLIDKNHQHVRFRKKIRNFWGNYFKK